MKAQKLTIKLKSNDHPFITCYQNDEWNCWTNKSKNTSFKSSNKEFGDGEEKLGVEYGIKPLGQNYTYDLEMPFNEKMGM